MTGFVALSDPKLPVMLRYPDPTPGGHPVEANKRDSLGSYRVHLTSDGSDEVYFEVGQYRGTTVEEAMGRFISEAAQNIPALEVGEPCAATFAGRTAVRFRIAWPGKERLITFLTRGDAVYRIIYDPRSPLNVQIAGSFQFTEPGT